MSPHYGGGQRVVGGSPQAAASPHLTASPQVPSPQGQTLDLSVNRVPPRSVHPSPPLFNATRLDHLSNLFCFSFLCINLLFIQKYILLIFIFLLFVSFIFLFLLFLINIYLKQSYLSCKQYSELDCRTIEKNELILWWFSYF